MPGHGSCTVCRHTQATKIDEQLLGGVAQRVLSKRYGLARSSLQRHQLNHINKVVVAEIDRASVAAGEAPGERLRRLYEGALADLERLQRRAEREKNYSAAIGAISQKLKALEIFVAAASREKKRDVSRPPKVRISFNTKDNVIVRVDDEDDEDARSPVEKPETDSSDFQPSPQAEKTERPVETAPPPHVCTSACTPVTCGTKADARDDAEGSNPRWKVF